jgi:hypothetical protein
MKALRDKTPAQLFAVWMGAWLTLNGVVALLSNPVLTVGTGTSHLIGGGSIANNGWHGVFHLVSGAIGLASASSATRALAFTWAIGVAYLLSAVWGFADGSTLLWIVPVDAPGSALHAAEGALAMAVGCVTRSAASRS